jgi:hypothetical protein
MNINTYFETLYQKAMNDFNEYVEMLYIQAKSKSSIKVVESIKTPDDNLIEIYLKKRGYTMNYILNKRVMIKDFTCVSVQPDYIEIWHDKTNNNKSIFITENYLTNIPITLNYMERI